MNRRKSMTVAADGNMVKKNRKYKPQNTLGNILECEECGAAYRRRTKRGKVVYRCATRIEKGEKLVKSLLLLRKNGLKRRLERRFVEGSMMRSMMRRLSKKNVDRVLVGKDGGIKILFV